MNCREYRSGLIEWGRGRIPGDAARQVLVAHLEYCDECSRFLETQQALSAAITDLVAEPIPPADGFLDPVMAEFDRAHPPKVRRMVPLHWGLAIGLAAAILVAVIATWRPAPHRQLARPVPEAVFVQPTPAPALASVTESTPVRRMGPARQAAIQEVAPEPERPFYPIPYSTPLLPGEWTRVERMKIPVAALIAAGFHLIAPDPGAAVEADVLVSQDGRARAIRPISILSSN